VAANCDTGVLNDLRRMSQATRRARVPFHTDAAQLFGRSAVRPAALGVDAFSATFHKLGGPPGVGVLVVRRALVDGYGLCPLICGGQNGGLRGGAENLPGLGASLLAFRAAMAGRATVVGPPMVVESASYDPVILLRWTPDASLTALFLCWAGAVVAALGWLLLWLLPPFVVGRDGDYLVVGVRGGRGGAQLAFAASSLLTSAQSVELEGLRADMQERT
jgi:hypothetical protein